MNSSIGIKNIELQDQWKLTKLKDILKETNEFVNKNKIYFDLPILSLTKNDGLILQSDRFEHRIATKDISKYKVIKKNWLIYNPYVLWEGAIHILKKFESGIVSPVYLTWDIINADHCFIDFISKTKNFLSLCLQLSSGVVQRRRAIKKNIFLEITLHLPPITEQKKIAKILSTIQEAKEKTEAVINAARELKKSLIKHLFIYGPIPLSEIDKIKFKPTEIGEIIEDWDVVKLGNIGDIKYGKAKPQGKGEIPCYGSGGVYDHINEYFIDFETLVVGRKGTAGKVYYSQGKIWVSDTAFYVERINNINIKFLFYYLSKCNISGEDAKTTLPSLQRSKLVNMNVPYPNTNDQKRIAMIIEGIDNKIETEVMRKKALEQLFKTLADKLMTGEIRVNNTEIQV